MIRISILYPNLKGGHFDFKYYLLKHMPRSIELLGKHKGFRHLTVERGIGGPGPNAAPAYLAACFYTFDTKESFIQAFMPHAQELQDDMRNYTDIPAEIQINEIVLEKSGL